LQFLTLRAVIFSENIKYPTRQHENELSLKHNLEKNRLQMPVLYHPHPHVIGNNQVHEKDQFLIA
jgi:hypothetical protein